MTLAGLLVGAVVVLALAVLLAGAAGPADD